MERFGLKSVMAVPRVSKITLNMGVGEAKENSKALDGAQSRNSPSSAGSAR